MSKIQVDAIEQQTACGTTLTAGGGAGKTVVVDATTVTLGRCGGTVALASGATQTGFGRTGTVDWITTPKTTGTFTAVSGEGYFLNTSGGVITANLPAGVAGAIVSFADYAATWQTNNVTVTPNGTDKIGGVNASVTLNTEGQSVTFIFVDSTQGWINTMDSTSNVRGNEFICASVSGACNTLATAPCCANVKIATFTGPGSFTVNAAAVSAANNTISYLVVGGGAGGGKACAGGGGGAGGFREVKSPSATGYTASPLDGYSTPGNRIVFTGPGAFPITVGAGGAGSTSTPVPGASGVNSVIAATTTITGAGGGGGGGAGTGCNPAGGQPGGSAGGGRGATAPSGTGGTGNTPPTSPSQGNNGGTGASGSGGYEETAAGGGGAGAVGVNAAPGGNAGGGAGGAGVATSITSSSVTYSGGGGGGTGGNSGPAIGAGGVGGGGSGGNCQQGIAATVGTINTGGGGGGSGGSALGKAKAGGSGIVIIRYRFQ